MGQGDKDVINRSLFYDSLDIVHTSQTFQRLEAGLVAVSQITDDAKAELAMRSHPLHDRASQLATSSDENSIEIFPGAVPSLHAETNEHPPGDHEQARADHENRQGGTGVRHVRTSRTEPEKNSRQNHRAHDRADGNR